jgi:hypothetical protein
VGLSTNTIKHRRQVPDVDEYIAGDRQIEIPGLRLQEGDQFAADQMVVDLTLPCDLDHVRGNVDPGQGSGERTKSRSDKTCAATQVQNVQIA